MARFCSIKADETHRKKEKGRFFFKKKNQKKLDFKGKKRITRCFYLLMTNRTYWQLQANSTFLPEHPPFICHCNTMKNVVIPQISGHIHNPFRLCSHDDNLFKFQLTSKVFNLLQLHIANVRLYILRFEANSAHFLVTSFPPPYGCRRGYCFAMMNILNENYLF